MEYALVRTNNDRLFIALAMTAAVACALAPEYALAAIGAIIVLAIIAALLLNHRLAFLAFAFSIPFATTQIIPIPGMSNLAFMMIAIFGLSSLCNIRRLPALSLRGLGLKPYLFGAFLFVSTASLLIAEDQARALKFYALALIIFGLYLISTAMLREKGLIQKAASWFLAGTFASGMFIFYDFITQPLAQMFYRAGASASGGINITICFLVAIPLSLALLEGEKRTTVRATYYTIAILSAAIILFSATRSAWLALIIYLAYELFKRPGRAFIAAVIIAVVVFGFMPIFMPFAFKASALRAIAAFKPEYQPQQYIGFRVENYSLAARMFADYPIIGVGLGNFPEHAGAVGRSVIPVELMLDAHNTYLEILTSGGLLGGLPYLFVWLITLLEFALVAGRGNAMQRRLATGLGIGFLLLMIHGLFHTIYLVMLIAPMFAFASALRREVCAPEADAARAG
jgi:O-antigen ligase